MKLHYALYGNLEDANPLGIVAYIVGDGLVVFSGIIPKAMSTINAAAEIVKRISEQENLKVAEFRFFDLLTSRCYPLAGEENREYSLRELVIDRRDKELVVKGHQQMLLGAIPPMYTDPFVHDLPWYLPPDGS